MTTTDLICISGGHWLLVDGTLTGQQSVVAITSVLQSDAMDALSKP